MKLPEEFAGEYDLRGMGHVQRLAETIVRDCAKVCANRVNGNSKQRQFEAEYLASAILARYGLEPK